MLTKNKKQRNEPINKDKIITSNYYIPYYVNEKEWTNINKIKNNWFDILYYNYGKNLFHNKEYNSQLTCSIDVGCKNFISLYGLDGICYKIKSNYEIINKILKNKKVSYKTKNNHIKNLINELHITSSKLICSQYDIIYIGLVCNKGNIDSKNMKSIEDNLLKIVSHKEFLDTLTRISKEYNKEIKIVEESYTSVQCGVCAEFNKFGRIFSDDDSERRKYSCKYCYSEFCRDINAARNIIIKNE